MKVYGLRIGKVGVEFSTQTDRQKALEMFTKGSTVGINEGQGVVYSDGEAVFGTYERETKENLVRCETCKAIHSSECCRQVEHPNKYSWKSEYESTTDFICDGCLAKIVKEKELFDAKKLVAEAQKSV
jgi:hypothetical protein